MMKLPVICLKVMGIEYVDNVTGKYCRQLWLLIQFSYIGQYIPPWSGKGTGKSHNGEEGEPAGRNILSGHIHVFYIHQYTIFKD